MNEIIDLLMSHTSVRKFKEQALNKKIVDTIINSAQMAPSSGNFQSYTMIEIKDSEKRRTLSKISGDQEWVIKAPLVLLFCGDLHRGQQYFEGVVDREVFSNSESFIVATVDAALAAQKALIAAQSMDIWGVFVGGIRNDVESVAKEFNLPEYTFPLFALCLGYPEKREGIKPRLPQEVVHKIDSYNEEYDDRLIETYNQTMLKYYDERTNGKFKETWTSRCGRQLMEKPRYHVGPFLRKSNLLLK